MKKLNIEVENAPIPQPPDPSVKALSVAEKIANAQKEEKERLSQQQPDVVAPQEFYVGNFYEYSEALKDDDNKHKWTLFVSCESDKITPCSHFIDHVDVELHHTFSPNKLTLKSDNLSLARFGWGTFDIKLTIHFVPAPPRKEVQVVHTLNFENPVTSSKVAVPMPVSNNPHLFSQLASKKGSLKHAQTVVTTINGDQYVEDNKTEEKQNEKKENKQNDKPKQ